MGYGKEINTEHYGTIIAINKQEWAILKPLTYECGWTDYDRNQVEMHLMNCGFGFLDSEYQKPIDNEYELEEIYETMGK